MYAVPIPGSELVGIDAVKIVNIQRRQQAAPGSGNFVFRGLKCGQSGTQLRIILLSQNLHIGEGRQRFGSLQVVHDGEVLIKVGEQDHG